MPNAAILTLNNSVSLILNGIRLSLVEIKAQPLSPTIIRRVDDAEEQVVDILADLHLAEGLTANRIEVYDRIHIKIMRDLQESLGKIYHWSKGTWHKELGSQATAFSNFSEAQKDAHQGPTVPTHYLIADGITESHSALAHLLDSIRSLVRVVEGVEPGYSAHLALWVVAPKMAQIMEAVPDEFKAEVFNKLTAEMKKGEGPLSQE